MRIIAGRFRGRKLEAVRAQATRPTADRVRESLFNMLASRFDLRDANVLDLYAGTGALGLEALSRGARNATFVELDDAAVDTILANVERLGVGDQARVVAEDVPRYRRLLDAARSESSDVIEPFDVIFADPPYGSAVDALPDEWTPFLGVGGYLVIEHDGATSFEPRPDHVVTRRFGRTSLSFLSHDRD